jgi:hypothetical protein
VAITSTVPDAKAALRDILKATPSLARVQVSWGWPGGKLQSEAIVLGDVPQSEQQVVAMRAGRLPKTESYLLDVIIRVERNSTEQEPVTRRAYELAAEVEDAVGDNRDLGGVVHFAEWQSATLEEQSDPTGATRIALLIGQVACEARLST